MRVEDLGPNQPAIEYKLGDFRVEITIFPTAQLPTADLWAILQKCPHCLILGNKREKISGLCELLIGDGSWG